MQFVKKKNKEILIIIGTAMVHKVLRGSVVISELPCQLEDFHYSPVQNFSNRPPDYKKNTTRIDVLILV